MENLNPNTIPLRGRHIIEASAGTGKTYNITELYIRLLLEKELSPKNILVMTFTKDATQEIISRVEEKIRDELVAYENKISKNDAELSENQGKEVRTDQQEKEYKLLKKALLEVDEAAIFTIHGFCKRVLSQQAFTSGLEMDISMEVDTDDILLEVVEDYFRKYINTDAEKFDILQSKKKHTPEKFLGKDGFKSVVKSNYDIETFKLEDITSNHIELKKEVSIVLEREKAFIFDCLVKAKNKQKKELDKEEARTREWEIIQQWLNDNALSNIPKEVSVFVNGNRYSRNPNKEEILTIFDDLKKLNSYDSLKDIEAYKLEVKANSLIVNICQDIRANFIEAKTKKSVLDFDDLIVKLRDAVYNSTELVKILQKEYPVALIDEFQDTDAIQYEILDKLYPKISNLPLERDADRRGVAPSDIKLPRHSTTATPSYQRGIDDLLLLMIGDPKQAIYAFRGGDIFTYLKAKNSAEYSWSMDTNWRSTTGMISAYNRLFYKQDYTPQDLDSSVENDIFSDGIGYQLIKSTPHAKVNKELITFKDDLSALNYFIYEKEKVSTLEGIKLLSKWTANEIVRLLNTNEVKEKDIAILVQNARQATAVRGALQDKKLNSVYLSQRDSIYESLEAKEVLRVLEGIAECENDSLLKQALSTSLMGGTADKFMQYLDEENPQYWDNVKDEALRFRGIWRKQGVMSLLLEVLHNKYTPRTDNNERALTNILHIAELLKVAENKYKQSLQLIKWYKSKLNNKSSNDENTLRLESDSNLIKIVTIHGSKGLEYPVVFVPFSTYVNNKSFNASDINKYYNGELNKTVYCIGKDPSVKEQVNREIIEELQRLLYVAITRASQRCYVGVANFDKDEKSSLAKFLDFKKGNNWSALLTDIVQNPANDSCMISFDSVDDTKLLAIQNEAKESLAAKDFIGKIENSWGMLSFSSMVRDNKPYEYSQDDKSSDESLDDISNPAETNKLTYRFTANKGSDIGNLLHSVLEESDFSRGVCIEKVDEFINRNLSAVKNKNEREDIKKWLDECLAAPIPSLYHERSFKLKDLSLNQVLKEPEFYFPIDNDNLWKTKLAKLLSEYRGEPTELPNNTKLHGMLHGFIDLIFSYNGRFFVADYKSNYLGDRLQDYTQETMSAKNQSSFYDLQYLIYAVALHRYLTINKKDYDFAKDFGGVYYFYLRGMKDGFGVYAKKLTKDIVLTLDNLFRGDENV